MSFKRNIIPQYYLTNNDLTSRMISIGFRLFGDPIKDANIEDTLVGTSIEGMRGDWRIQGLLVDWLDIHGDKILADRLTHMVLDLNDKIFKDVKLFWCAFAQKCGDIRFKKLLSFKPRRRHDILADTTEFLIRRHGEDPRFVGTCLRVPNQLLRHRPSNIMTPEELANYHAAYRYRVLIGSTPRSDMFACLEQNKGINTYALAKACYGSYRTAMAVKRDYGVLNGSKYF